MSTNEATIQDGEYHPIADDAMHWLRQFMLTQPHEYAIIKESIYSTALSGHRASELCASTITRLANSEPVSDRYLLALAWLVRSLAEKEKS
jgi:hypothetical protein